jgi:lipopolysaccharide export system permease protein
MARGPIITQLDRYILRQLLASLAAVTTALVALIWLTQSLRFVELVVNRGLSLRVFVQLTGLLIPNFVAVILPITTFVSVQFFVYQRLMGDRELTVMRAAGLSPWALSRPALMAGILAMLVGFGLNIWVVPASNTAFKEFQFELRNKVAAFLLQEGVFTPISDQLTVYVRSRDRDGTLHGIMVEDDRQSNTRATILAESGRLMSDGDTPRVLLENGSRQEIDAKTGRLDVLTFAEDTIDLTSNGHGEDAQRARDDSEMSLQDLLHPSPDVIARGDAGKFLVEAHRRLTQPLTTIGFTLVALVSVLTGSFRRAGNLWRPVASVLLMVGLLAVGLTAQSVGARHPALVWLIWVQALTPGLACAWILFMPGILAGTAARRRAPSPMRAA